jgi:hypothetical protein
MERQNPTKEDTMTANVGTTDRIIRAAVAIAALIGAYLLGFSSVGGIILIVVAVVALITAAAGFCPLYRVLGISTCPVRR